MGHMFSKVCVVFNTIILITIIKSATRAIFADKKNGLPVKLKRHSFTSLPPDNIYLAIGIVVGYSISSICDTVQRRMRNNSSSSVEYKRNSKMSELILIRL